MLGSESPERNPILCNHPSLAVSFIDLAPPGSLHISAGVVPCAQPATQSRCFFSASCSFMFDGIQLIHNEPAHGAALHQFMFDKRPGYSQSRENAQPVFLRFDTGTAGELQRINKKGNPDPRSSQPKMPLLAARKAPLAAQRTLCPRV